MSPIKDFKLVYVAPNKENIFSDGDTVAGKVTFELKEETKVKGVIVKVKGEARVHWTDGTGDRRKTHSDRRRYFKDKVRLVEEGKTRLESFTGAEEKQNQPEPVRQYRCFCDNRCWEWRWRWRCGWGVMVERIGSVQIISLKYKVLMVAV